jgi:hypothetical protein
MLRKSGVFENKKLYNPNVGFFAAIIIALFASGAFGAGYSCSTYKKYTSCAAGYFMVGSSSSSVCNATPAAGNACKICNPGNYCTGGTACFAKCAANTYSGSGQGSCTACPSGLKSPVGSSSSTLCGKILHYGNNFIYLLTSKRTSPSLVVNISGTKYYGNMQPTNPNDSYINSIRIRSDGVVYDVYDDAGTNMGE